MCEVINRLEELGLVSFCKTTGGRGLHVVADGKKVSCLEAKGFARDVCLRVARDNSELYLIKIAKNQRNVRIFLGCILKHCMGTAVAPLSPHLAGLNRIDTAHLEPSEDGFRSETLDHSHRAEAPSENQRLAGLLRQQMSETGDQDVVQYDESGGMTLDQPREQPTGFRNLDHLVRLRRYTLAKWLQHDGALPARDHQP